MDLFSRREFLNRSAILAAASAAVGTGVAAADQPKPVSAGREDKLRVAVVGVHGRGKDHVKGFLGNSGCEITTVCDCDEAVIGDAMKKIEGKQGKAPKYEKDIRKLLENKDIDIVSIATPNHWHALMAVWAMQNGKDVYVEKPATHNVHEGVLMTAAARKYKRICQVGTQSRSNPGMRDAIAYVRGGKLGKVDLAIGLCYKRRDSIGKVTKPTEPPATMDYDLWCGPAAKLPVMRAKVHYDWHWVWNTGCGDLGNQGVHEMDKARWALGKTTMPDTAFSLGGRFGYIDDGETANTQLCVFDYGQEKMIFEVRGLPTKGYKGAMVGNIFVGSEGYVVCPNYEGGIAYDKDGKELTRFGWDAEKKQFVGTDQHHFDNFVKVVRNRKVEEQNCDIAEGHLSAALCHLANISYRLGNTMPIGKADSISDNKTVNEFAARMLEHLSTDKINVAETIGRFGPVLAIDTKTETIVNLDGEKKQKANAMLFRNYRKGFELTETV